MTCSTCGWDRAGVRPIGRLNACGRARCQAAALHPPQRRRGPLAAAAIALALALAFAAPATGAGDVDGTSPPVEYYRLGCWYAFTTGELVSCGVSPAFGHSAGARGGGHVILTD